MFILKLLASLPVFANTGAISALDARGGVVWVEPEQRDVAIATELLWLRVDQIGTVPVATWGVAYEFDNHASRTVDQPVAFPVEGTLGHGFVYGNPCVTETRMLAALEQVMSRDPGLARVVEAMKVEDPSERYYGGWDAIEPLTSAIRSSGDLLRLELRPEDLAAAGLLAFDVRQGDAAIPVESAVLELRPNTHQALRRSHESPLGMAMYRRHWEDEDLRPLQFTAEELEENLHPLLRSNALVRFTLHLPPGRSRLIVRYSAPVPFGGDDDLRAWTTSYFLGSGRTWAGPIGALQLRVDRGALRGGMPPALPFPGAPALDGDALVWTTTGYEPAPKDRVVVGGASFDPFDVRPLPANRAAVAKEDAWHEPDEIKLMRALWRTPNLAGLPAGAPQASSTARGSAWLPIDLDGTRVFDVGFGPDNAIDGGLATAWCAMASATEPATLRFDPGRLVSELSLHLGWRTPWTVGDCTEDGVSLQIYSASDKGAPRCAAPATAAASGTRPARVQVSVAGADARTFEVSGEDLDVPGPFSPGPIQLELYGATASPTRTCLADVTVKTSEDPVFAPLREELERWMGAPAWAGED